MADEKLLLEVVACPQCALSLCVVHTGYFCKKCGVRFPIVDGALDFIGSAPDGCHRIEKKVLRVGSDWRQANNNFFHRVARDFDSEALVLDVGAGHSYLKAFFRSRYLATDIYPYKGLHFVCDLSKASPLRAASLDAVLLNNVLEHLIEPNRMLDAIARALKPGGELNITVPFIIKLHQAPYDFMRYTHYKLNQMLSQSGFNNLRIEAVYTPASLLRIFFRERATMSASCGLRRVLVLMAWQLSWQAVKLAERVGGSARYHVVPLPKSDATAPSPWVTGYHLRAHKV